MISGVALEERTTTFKIESDVVTEGINLSRPVPSTHFTRPSVDLMCSWTNRSILWRKK